MYNYNNLSDFEFGILCRDIMQKKLGIKLYTFEKGRDSGIDVTDDPKNKNVIIQVKHYIDSKYSDLLGTFYHTYDCLDDCSLIEFFWNLDLREFQNLIELAQEYDIDFFYMQYKDIFLDTIKTAISAYMEDIEADAYYAGYDIGDLLNHNMRYNGYYEELDKESVVDTVCEWIKEDVEQEVFEMIEKLPQDILGEIEISKNHVNIERADVEGFVERYLDPSEPDYDHHERDYDFGIVGEMDVLDCIFK